VDAHGFAIPAAMSGRTLTFSHASFPLNSEAARELISANLQQRAQLAEIFQCLALDFPLTTSTQLTESTLHRAKWLYRGEPRATLLPMGAIKKQTAIALGLLLLIPAIVVFDGVLFRFIDPEIAAGHPNYAQNYHMLEVARRLSIWGSAGVLAILWLAVCFLVIRSKQRSWLWIFLAVFGPFGFAALAMLNDNAPAATDRYARFVRGLNWFARSGYESCVFVVIWALAYGCMLLKSNLSILYESATSGMSTAQVIDIRNASSGMWAFAEGNEVMYMVAVLYLLVPVVFNIAARMRATNVVPDAR